MNNQAVQPAQKIEPVSFFTVGSHAVIVTRKPDRAIVNGVLQDTNSKTAEFVPLGDGFSRYVTSDPEEIQALSSNPRVMSAEEYNNAILGPEQRAALANIEKSRLMTENNQLLSVVAQQEKQLREMQERIAAIESKGKAPSAKNT